jgi:transposase
MESTGSYWKPVFNVLKASLTVCLAKSEDVNGRKAQDGTGQMPSGWLTCCDTDGASQFVPPRPIRELRGS